MERYITRESRALRRRLILLFGKYDSDSNGMVYHDTANIRTIVAHNGLYYIAVS